MPGRARTSGFKRQVSPGAAAVLVVLVLAIVQWVWWRGLVFKPNGPAPGPRSSGGAPPPNSALILKGHTYVTVDTVAGDLDPGEIDGAGYAARFDRPTGLALQASDGKLLICDTGNNRIRSLDVGGWVTTISGSRAGYQDGAVASAQFDGPCGICVAPNGDYYVADTGNGKVRRIHEGVVSTVPLQDTTGTGMNEKSRTIFRPTGIAWAGGPTGSLVVADAATKTINRYDTAGKLLQSIPLPAVPVYVAADSDNNLLYSLPGSGVLVNGNKTYSNTPIVGAESYADDKTRPAIKHPIAACRIGPNLLVTDTMHASVFLVKNGAAEVLAGLTSSAGPARDWRDGNGETAFFNDLTGIVCDGKTTAYVSDTANNCIRRIALPDFLFH